MHSALSSAPALYLWPALILPHWSESPFLECPYSCLRLCPIEITEHFSWGHISVSLRYFCCLTLLHNICPSKDAFFLLLSFAFSCSPKEAAFRAQRKNLFLHTLQIYSDNQLTMGSVQFSSCLPSHVVYPDAYYKTWTWADPQSPWERGRPNTLTLYKPAQAHAYAVGRHRGWTRALCQQTVWADILHWLPVKSGKGKQVFLRHNSSHLNMDFKNSSVGSHLVHSDLCPLTIKTQQRLYGEPEPTWKLEVGTEI